MIANSLLVIFIASRPVFSNNLDSCTISTMECPPAEKWTERGKIFNCPGTKRYTCLMSTENNLREGCKFEVIIQAGQTGCPYTEQCDPKTDQPVLVLPRKYLPCPPDKTGCPPRNHSGYSILNIYKYPSCQKRKLTDTSVSSAEKSYIPTTLSVTTNDKKMGVGAGIGIGIASETTIILVIVIVGIIVFLRRRGRSEKYRVGQQGIVGILCTVNGGSIQSLTDNLRDLETESVINNKDIDLTTKVDVPLQPISVVNIIDTDLKTKSDVPLQPTSIDNNKDIDLTTKVDVPLQPISVVNNNDTGLTTKSDVPLSHIQDNTEKEMKEPQPKTEETMQSSSPDVKIILDSLQLPQICMGLPDSDDLLEMSKDKRTHVSSYNKRNINRPLTNDEDIIFSLTAQAPVQRTLYPDLMVQTKTTEGIEFGDSATESDVSNIKIGFTSTTAHPIAQNNAFRMMTISEMDTSDHTFSSIPTNSTNKLTNSPSSSFATASENEQKFLQFSQQEDLQFASQPSRRSSWSSTDSERESGSNAEIVTYSTKRSISYIYKRH